MRPVRLAVEGLTAFPTRQEIDLSRLGLFCITGATGAGKTTIFDAIAFALYGRAPRVANRVRRLVTGAQAVASVELDFQAGGNRYRVSRRLRLKASGGSQHHALLEQMDGDTPRAVADGADQVSAHIEEITGLDFSAFTRAVMLPQGDFARLLGGEAAQRRAILVRLLDLGRVEDAGRRARSQADALRGQERVLRESLDGEMSDATLDALRAAKADLRRAGIEASALDEALRAARTHEATAREGIALADRALRIAAAAHDLAHADDAARAEGGDIEPKVAQADAEVQTSEHGHHMAEAHLAARRAELDEIIRAHGDEALHATLRASLREMSAAEADLRGAATEVASAHEALHAARNALRARQADLWGAEQVALATARTASAAAEAAAREAAAALARVTAARDEASNRLAHLERHHLGASLRGAMADGEPCPVCERPLDGALPPVPGDLAEELDIARTAAGRARQDEAAAAADDRAAHARREAAHQAVIAIEERIATLERPATPPAPTRLTPAKARSAVESAEKHLSRLRERVAAASAGEAGASRRRGDAEGRLAQIFGSPLPAAVEQRIARREEQLAGARRRVAEADAARDVARSAAEAARTRREALMGARAQLAAESRARMVQRRRLANELAELAGAGDAMPAAEDAAARALSAAARRFADARAADAADAVAEIERQGRDAGCPPPGDGDWIAALNAAARRAAATVARQEVAVAGLRDRIRQRGEREARLATISREAGLLETLALHLRSDRFIEFMLAESVETLCRHASARLEEMSAGRYSLEMEVGEASGELVVVDHHNADERRGVDTLSGGETFQASLALALALSESVADLGGLSRLDAVFVDEGFAALDAESLDLAIDALESVQAGGRMVGVITHMPQMAERIPDGLEVVKGASGSTIVPRAA